LGLSDADAAAVQAELQDGEDSNSYYIKFEINNRRANTSATAGIFQDGGSWFRIQFHRPLQRRIRRGLKVMEKMEVGPTVFYEHFTSSGVDPETAYRIGAAIGMRYHFTNSLTLARLSLYCEKLEFAGTGLLPKSRLSQLIL